MKMMKTKLLVVSALAVLSVGCLNKRMPQSPTGDTEAVVTNDSLSSTLTLTRPVTIVANTIANPSVKLTKITVNKSSHQADFYFSQSAPLKPFMVSLQPKDGDECINNMKMVSRQLSNQLNTDTGQTYTNNSEFSCAAVNHALFNNGTVTDFLKGAGFVCG